MQRAHNILLTCWIIAPLVAAAASNAQDTTDRWASTLASRIRATDERRPIVNQVVLVPDEATYLDEVSKWSDEGYWPVLFDEQTYAPLLIRRFRPERIVRRPSIRQMPRETKSRQRLAERTVREVWGGGLDEEPLAAVFTRSGHTPSGVLFTSMADSAWTAAIALAAGRGQPILWLDDNLGPGHGELSLDAAVRLFKRQVELLDETGMPYASIGDAIDTITLCRTAPGRVNVGNGPNNQKDLRALTDSLGRGPDGHRFAFAGWIFGTRERCAYAAMCSLFLDRESFRFVNTYPTTQVPWSHYDVADASVALSEAGFRTSIASSREITASGWQQSLARSISADVLLMNTKGNQTWFEMADGRLCHAGDVPVLLEPLVVHFAHSWSMAIPVGGLTIGSQWLAHGAYGFVGSVQEPGLAAFKTPRDIASRIRRGIPFLIACRQWAGPPGRLNTYGDPLMVCRATPREHIKPTGQPNGADLRAGLPALLRQARATGDGDVFAEAIHASYLLGEDRVAIELWRHAARTDNPARAARAALPVLFKHREADQFMEAWFALAQPDHFAGDMLWHLMWPRLRATTDDNTLLALKSAARGPINYSDIERLAPFLSTAFGAGFVQTWIQKELAATSNSLNQRKLREMLSGQ